MKRLLIVASLIMLAGNGVARGVNIDALVAEAVREALEYGRIDPVLVWIKPEYEEEVRVAFERAEDVRRLNPDAQVLAERFFVETVLRVHHAGDGTSFTGIERGGPRLSPVVAMAVQSVENGNIDRFGERVADYAAASVRERYAALMEKKKHRAENLEAGRAFADEYVSFLRFIDELFSSMERRGQ